MVGNEETKQKNFDGSSELFFTANALIHFPFEFDKLVSLHVLPVPSVFL